jgi:Ca-activated chloride channel homolog
LSFARPELLWLALLALPELLLGLRRTPILRASVGVLAGPRRRAAAEGRFAAFSLSGTAAACLFALAAAIALAGPSWGARGAVVERRGLEAAIVLDVSRSMEIRDGGSGGRGAETRLEAAKSLVGALVEGRGGDEGSVAFSLVAAKGGAVLLVPMTEDRFALEDALAYANPDSISVPGTDLEAGLRAALPSFSASGAQGRVVFLFSDGGELRGNFRRACEEAAALRVRLVVVGLGGPVPLPVPGPDGAPLAGEKGPVLSALDAKALEGAAAAAGGRYVSASDAGAGAALAEELGVAAGKGMRIEYELVDRSSLFALAALAFLVASILASMLAPRGERA